MELPNVLQQLVGDLDGQQVLFLSWHDGGTNNSHYAKDSTGKGPFSNCTPVALDEFNDSMRDDIRLGYARVHEPEWGIPVTSAWRSRDR